MSIAACSNLCSTQHFRITTRYFLPAKRYSFIVQAAGGPPWRLTLPRTWAWSACRTLAADSKAGKRRTVQQSKLDAQLARKAAGITGCPLLLVPGYELRASYRR